MVGASVGLGLVETVAVDRLQALFSTSPARSISWWAQDVTGTQAQDVNGQPLEATLFPQIVVEEKHLDRLVLTRHPVERGSQITDHAYRLPAQVQVRGGWSFATGGFSLIPVPTDPSYLQALYGVLLQLLQQRVFTTVVTGKRLYTYMLLETLEVHTDPRTENVLSFVANFEEVLIAVTQTVDLPDSSVMQNPLEHQPTVQQGTTSLQAGSAVNIPALQTPLPSLNLSSVQAASDAGGIVGNALGSTSLQTGNQTGVVVPIQ